MKHLQTPEEIILVIDDNLTTPFAYQPPLSFDSPMRLRIWEIEDRFKCPVIGWCFDASEQKEILRKEGISTKDKSNMRIHETVVESLGEENRLSQRIDFWLNRKYQKEIQELSSLAEEEFVGHWKAFLKKGDVEGILWVAVTKSDLSAEAKRSIFGDVHMEMHVRAKKIGLERRKLDQEQEKNGILAESVREVSRANKILKRENEELRNELAVACRLSETLQRQNRVLEKELSKVNENDFIASMQKETAELRVGRDENLKQISDYQRELRKLQNQNSKLLFRLQKQSPPDIHRDDEPGSSVKHDSSSSLPNRISSIDLSQRCVLVVGGVPKMESLYRRLIERNKGIFEYHDGRMNTGTRELVNQVRRADLVL